MLLTIVRLYARARTSLPIEKWHAVPIDTEQALCGAKSQFRSFKTHHCVTCLGCQAKLAEMVDKCQDFSWQC